jgi:hypothetical protein
LNSASDWWMKKSEPNPSVPIHTKVEMNSIVRPL